MSGSIVVGSATAEPGERSSGWLVVGELDQIGFARGQIRLPVLIANGRQDGPMLALIAGQHPGEYVGMNTAIDIVTTVDTEKLAGSIVAMPVLNPAGVRAKKPYICPYDGLNMNRQWPGSYGGTVSMRTVHAVWNALVMKADYFIDLHGGDFPEYQADYAICFESGDEALDATSRDMARHFGAPYIRKSALSEGGQETGPSARMAIQVRRIPAIVTEVGDAGALDESRLRRNVEGILNIISLLDMLPGNPAPVPQAQREMINRTPVLANRTGLSRIRVSIGESVKKGQALAEIRSVFGRTVEVIESPVDGDVVQLFYQGWINEGEIVAKIASLAPESTEEEAR